MGGVFGKICAKETRIKDGKKGKKDGGDRIEIELRDSLEGEGEKDEEDLEMEYLKDLLHNNLQMFVLNNLLLSVQFFCNFEEEIEELRKEAARSDGTILDEHRMKHLQADKLMERVGTYVVMRHRHGPNKNAEVLLHPLRSYLIYQNVSVEDDKHKQITSEQEAPFYKLSIEELDDHFLRKSGFMNLKKVDAKVPEVIYERIGEPSKSEKEANDPFDIYNARRLTLQIPQSANQESGYATLLELASSKPLQKMLTGNIISTSCELPDTTFKIEKRAVYKRARRTGLEGLTIVNVYLKSESFVTNFGEVLIDRLAEPLMIARAVPGAQMQCSRISVSSGKVTHHITPVLTVPWWPEQGDEFLRPVGGMNPWPTKHIQKSIRKSGAYLLPLGNLQRHGKNPNYEIQWRYITPRAEEILLTYTMHAHIRCYLFTIAIFKTFLIEENTCLGLEHTHILHFLFWQIHKDFAAWPETRPAESLLNFLTRLQSAIQKRKIKDFFLRDRNLLESSPFIFLNKAQGTLNKILENPLPYILLAIKSMHLRSTFFPQLDYSHIYKLVTVPDVLSFMNPHLIPKKRKKKDDDESDEDDDEDEIRQYRKAMYKELKREKAEKEQEARKDSVETIDLNQVIIQDDDLERRREVLTTFIQHFKAMGRKSREYKTVDQAIMYFTQAKILVKLQTEVGEEEHTIRDHLTAIEREIRLCEFDQGPDSEEGVKFRVNNDSDKEITGHRLSRHDRELPKLPNESISHRL